METIIVKSAVREVIGDKFNLGSDAVEKVNEIAVNTLQRAGEISTENKRKTIQGKDVFAGKVKNKVILVKKPKVEGKNIGGDLVVCMSQYLADAIKMATLRADANGRKTIGGKDFL